jgi:hypothetical protein
MWVEKFAIYSKAISKLLYETEEGKFWRLKISSFMCKDDQQDEHLSN